MLLVTRASQQNTESTPNADSNSEYIPHEERGTHENEPDGGLETGNVQVTSTVEPNVDVNTPVEEDPEPENIPEAEDNSESDIDDQPSPEDKPGSTEDEGHEEWDDSYPEGAQEPEDLNPENNPVVENGFLHLPFNDFDGPVPNDIFIPVDERSDPQEPNLEPENVPEYWWENEPEFFYDDEYAYINLLPEYDREAESYRTRGEAEAEYETEPENEAEKEGNVEPEFEYMSYLKGTCIQTYIVDCKIDTFLVNLHYRFHQVSTKKSVHYIVYIRSL